MNQFQSSHLVSVPVNDRPDSTKSSIRLFTFNLLFFISLLLLHLNQLIFFPLVFIKAGLDGLFWKINTFSKEAFTFVLVLATQVFGPTSFVITVDEGLDLRQMVNTDHTGRVLSIKLPKRSVTVANHQIYADWLYIWCLAYLAQLHGSIVIILKASLKWVPILGPAMQLFFFIFLDRSWASDKPKLTEHLTTMAEQASETQSNSSKRLENLTLLIFPEGTLVSPLTRPVSDRYAEKMGHETLRHCLLPRSTGTLFALRALLPKIPDLQFVDLTIGYPGIPARGNGQDFYTLQSIFGYGHSPPKVHVHLRILPMSSIPIGTSFFEREDDKQAAEIVDPTAEEAAEFDQWLRKQWSLKDDMLERFYQTGEMCATDQAEDSKGLGKLSRDLVTERRVEAQVRLRGCQDALVLTGLWACGVIIMWLHWTFIISPLRVSWTSP